MNQYNQFSNIFSLMRRINCLNESQYNNSLGMAKTILTEAMSIDKAVQTFSSIPENDLKILVGIDPTYKGGDTVGKLFPWIANSYLNDKSIIENPEYSKQIINIFKNNQNRFTQQTNIKQFKTIEQMKQFLNSQGMLSQNDGDDIANSIDNAEVRQGTKVVLNGSTWLIIVPTNYAAARHWGANTSWCTAADNDGSQYERYLNDYGGQYYILINKQNEYDKYQFHFESRQFMDANDTQIGDRVYNLDDFEELDNFFTKELSDEWADAVVEEGEEYEDNWEIEDTFSTYPTINVCLNRGNGLYYLKNEYGDDVFDGSFEEVGSISEETGCAKFKNNNGYGLLYLKQDRRGGETIEVYVSNLDELSDNEVIITDDEEEEWFYIGKDSNSTYKLITNYEQTMEEDYDSLIAKYVGNDNHPYIIAELNGRVGLMDTMFSIQRWLPGSEVINTPHKNGVILRNENQKDGCMLYNLETNKHIDIPMYGRLQMFGYWLVGWNNSILNIYDLYNENFLFGEPFTHDVDFNVNTSYSKENPTFQFRTNSGIVKFDSFRRMFFQKDGDVWRSINDDDAYNAIMR